MVRTVRLNNVSSPLLRKEGTGVVDNQGIRGDLMIQPDITIELLGHQPPPAPPF